MVLTGQLDFFFFWHIAFRAHIYVHAHQPPESLAARQTLTLVTSCCRVAVDTGLPEPADLTPCLTASLQDGCYSFRAASGLGEEPDAVEW